MANYTRPAAVYRLYDSAGQLLYIESSVNPTFRWDVYARTAPWWPQVARKTLEWHERPKLARRAATQAIQAERPTLNPAAFLYGKCSEDRRWCAETQFGSDVAKALVMHAQSTEDPHRLPLEYERLAATLEVTEAEIRSAVAVLVANGHARITSRNYFEPGERLTILTPSMQALEIRIAEDRAENDARAALRAKRQRRAHIPAAVRSQVYERDRHTCQECGAKRRLSLDHIHPWSLGGPDTIDNLQTLCVSCNSRKQDRVQGVTSRAA